MEWRETITLVHRGDDDTYTCTVIPRASWFGKTVINTSGDGARPVNAYTVRYRQDLAPATGDYIVKGVISLVTKPADMAGREHLRVTSVGDNRRGILPHWRCDGS